MKKNVKKKMKKNVKKKMKKKKLLRRGIYQ